jgi:hypothetical protein
VIFINFLFEFISDQGHFCERHADTATPGLEDFLVSDDLCVGRGGVAGARTNGSTRLGVRPTCITGGR